MIDLVSGTSVYLYIFGGLEHLVLASFGTTKRDATLFR
jgi:hypothetical protein